MSAGGEPGSDRARLALRGLGAAAAMVAITLLLMQIAHRVLDGEGVVAAEGPEEPAVAALDDPDTPTALRISAIEPVRVEVVVDGETRFSGVLCSGPPPDCPRSSLEFERGEVMSVELADLTRARVSYNGTRVEPLGKLSAKRRLVFVDDSER